MIFKQCGWQVVCGANREPCSRDPSGRDPGGRGPTGGALQEGPCGRGPVPTIESSPENGSMAGGPLLAATSSSAPRGSPVIRIFFILRYCRLSRSRTALFVLWMRSRRTLGERGRRMNGCCDEQQQPPHQQQPASR